jgi:hypothetical protein
MTQHGLDTATDVSAGPGPALSRADITTCATCGQPSPSSRTPHVARHIYAIGKIEARFPRLSVEKEFSQVLARSDTKGLTDQQAQRQILSQRENRYLARQMCWVLTIEGIETYVLLPRDPADLDLLVDAIRETPSPTDIDVVIGSRGPTAPAELCNGLTIDTAIFDQIYSFNEQTLLKAIPKPKGIDSESFHRASAELLQRVLQMADNTGAADSHRALNYLTVRYPAIYARLAEAFAQDCSLASVTPVPSRLSSTRSIVDVIFAFVNRHTDVTEKFFTRVDVTEEFPFLVTKLSPYYDH